MVHIIKLLFRYLIKKCAKSVEKIDSCSASHARKSNKIIMSLLGQHMQASPLNLNLVVKISQLNIIFATNDKTRHKSILFLFTF